jgi:hydroxymethylpyrimidine/phosphomethylpyrimidine kinase
MSPSLPSPPASDCEHAPQRYVRVLSIAGSDSGGGAGIQADLKTCLASGCYGMTAITAITAQNTRGVSAVHALPPDLLTAQIDAVIEDIGVDAVKIGMLHDAEVVRAVARALRRHRPRHVVLDPVMVATSGDRLIAPDTQAVLVRELFPLVDLLTPNLDEASWLLGRALDDVQSLAPATRDLQALGARAVLLKGGHLEGPVLTDLLLHGDTLHRWDGPRIDTRNTHGTGCTLSTAVACELALGRPLTTAVERARDYVRTALQAGAGLIVGQGHGPLNHGASPRPAVHRPVGFAG